MHGQEIVKKILVENLVNKIVKVLETPKLAFTSTNVIYKWK